MTDSIYTKRPISHEEAREVAGRLINSHFRKEPCARVGIPARPDYDDDLLICAYIKQQQAEIERLRALTYDAERELENVLVSVYGIPPHKIDNPVLKRLREVNAHEQEASEK